MMLSCWFLQAKTFNKCWNSFQTMVLDEKKVSCPLQVKGRGLLQVEEFKYLRGLFTSGGRMKCENNRRINAVATAMQSIYQ